jgi:N-formylglutamate deformylase
MILHIPHASIAIPDDIRPSILLSDAGLHAELLRMTDRYTDELFDPPIVCTRIIAPVSRLVCDVERFPDDRDEPMAARGMGAIYIRTSDERDLRSLNTDERQALIDRFYTPHHAALYAAVTDELIHEDTVLIIDCHSFSSAPLPHEPDQSPDRPQICIGTDPFHTPPMLADTAAMFFRDHGFTVALNTPFSGALVPLDFYRHTPEIHSLMIECNRSLYMDENTGEKTGGFAGLKAALDAFLVSVA